jgi:thiol:disulfide interchange protein DsbD
MEQNIFTDPAVAEALGGLTLARLYTDTGERATEYQKLQTDRYQTASLPFYAIETPDGQTIATFDGLTRDAAAFAAFVKSGR